MWPNFKQEELALYFCGRQSQYYNLGVFLYRKVYILKEGSFFGELSLINSAPRSATVLCKLDCELYSLNKINFDKIFSGTIASETRKKQFFENYFKGLPPSN